MISHVDMNWIKKQSKRKHLRVSKHPQLLLYVAKYTQSFSYDGKWCPWMMSMRGIVFDNDGNIIGRSLNKFFNIHENIPINDEYYNETLKLITPPTGTGYRIYEKLDGSYFQLSYYKGQWIPSTMGSFISDQAIKGMEIFNHKYNVKDLDPELTYMFEVIYPDNYNIVDYGLLEDVILIAVRNTKTGEDIEVHKFRDQLNIVDEVSIHNINSIEELLDRIPMQKEGFVVRYDNGFRLKVKSDWYFEMHHLVHSTTINSIIEYLSQGKEDELLSMSLPTHIHNKLRDDIERLKKKYNGIIRNCKQYFQSLDCQTRKEYALAFRNKGIYSGILFALLDGKDPNDYIWKIIKAQEKRATE